MTDIVQGSLERMKDNVRGRRAAPPPVTFPDVVHAHAAWRKEVEERGRGVDDSDHEYHRALAAFERAQGRLVDAYWCSSVESAVALTEKPRPRLARWLRGPVLRFHRTSDWATKGAAEVAEELHRCDELAIRASHILTGLRQKICLRLVMTSASHLMSLVDAPAAHEAQDMKNVVEHERKKLDDVVRYYCDAANGQAQVVYFVGMAVAAVALALLAMLGGVGLALPHIDNREFFGCLTAGSLGALVSVIQRINSGRFDLEFDMGRPYLVFLGALRPAMGAAFGLAFYFAVTSDILNVFDLPEEGSARFYALLVIAFLAGFSERWAKDTLTATLPSSPRRDDTAPAPPPAISQ